MRFRIDEDHGRLSAWRVQLPLEDALRKEVSCVSVSSVVTDVVWSTVSSRAKALPFRPCVPRPKYADLMEPRSSWEGCTSDGALQVKATCSTPLVWVQF